MPSLSRAVYLLFSPLMRTGTGDPLGGEEEGFSDWDSRTRYLVVPVPMVEKCGGKGWRKRFN